MALRRTIRRNIDDVIVEYIESNFKSGTLILNYWDYQTTNSEILRDKGYCVCSHDLRVAQSDSHQKGCLASIYDVVVNFHTLAFTPVKSDVLKRALYEMIDSVHEHGTLIIGIDSRIDFRRNRFLLNTISDNFVDIMDYSKKSWGLLLVATNRRSIFDLSF